MKLTPFNITLACLLVWFISEINLDTDMTFSWGWLLALCVILSVLDLGFRILFKELKRLWMMEVGFLVLVGILMLLIKVV